MNEKWVTRMELMTEEASTTEEYSATGQVFRQDATSFGRLVLPDQRSVSSAITSACMCVNRDESLVEKGRRVFL